MFERRRVSLRNAMEAGEKRKDPQLAREVRCSIPREMENATGIALAWNFVQRAFVNRGMVADLNVHWHHAPDGSPKPHAHVMLSMREAGPGGLGKKVRGVEGHVGAAGLAEALGEHVDGRLAELGIEARIDRRPLKDQDVELEPQHKTGPAGAPREDRGEDAERAADQLADRRRHGVSAGVCDHVDQAAKGRAFSSAREQRDAFERITGREDLALVAATQAPESRR